MDRLYYVQCVYMGLDEWFMNMMMMRYDGCSWICFGLEDIPGFFFFLKKFVISPVDLDPDTQDMQYKRQMRRFPDFHLSFKFYCHRFIHGHHSMDMIAFVRKEK